MLTSDLNCQHKDQVHVVGIKMQSKSGLYEFTRWTSVCTCCKKLLEQKDLLVKETK